MAEETQDKDIDKGGIDGGDDNKVLAARVSAAERLAAETQAKLDKFTKDKKDADDNDRLKKGEHENLIAELKSQNESTASVLKAYEKSLDERAVKLLEKFDDDDKARVEKYKTRLSKADWLTMIEEEIEIMGGGHRGDVPPSPTPGGGKSNTAGGDRELQPQSMEILDMLGVNPDKAKRLKVTKLADGNVRFSDTIRGFLDKLKERASSTPARRERKQV